MTTLATVMSGHAFELDHVFVMTSVGAPESAALARAGLAEGPPNTHPGQGTACRRFVLGNAYIELLWVHDDVAVRSEAIRKTRLWERWAGRGGETCPFGVVLRPAGEAQSPPFEFWDYRPPYLPSPLAIHVARDVPLNEPAFFSLPFARREARLGRADSSADERLPAIAHVTISGPSRSASTSALAVTAGDWLTLEGSTRAHTMTLVLENRRRDDVVDCQPGLPLVLR